MIDLDTDLIMSDSNVDASDTPSWSATFDTSSASNQLDYQRSRACETSDRPDERTHRTRLSGCEQCF